MKLGKYESCYVKYHIIFKNLMEHGFQCLDPGMKIHQMFNGIRCDNLPTMIARVGKHPDNYEKDFYAVVIYLLHYI